MKILVFDHNAVWREYRKRYLELSKLERINITVVTPEYLDMQFKREYFQKKGSEEKLNIFVVKPLFTFKSHRGWLNPLQIMKYIKQVKPDIIYIDAEPEAWYSSEIIYLKNLLNIHCKIILSTWMNINLYKIGFPYKFPFIYNFNYKYSLKNADGVLSYTSESESILRINGFHGKIKKINWGIDLYKFKKIDPSDYKRNLNLKDFTIGFCGRFVKEKGILNLIRAIAKLDKEKISVLLIGEGPLKKKIANISSKYSVDIRMIAPVENSIMPYFYNCMDVFVLPSLTTKYWKEQFGRVLIEAMACEVPVIGSSSGEIPYVINKTGLIFKEGDEDDLAKEIYLLMQNGELRERNKILGRQRAEKYFAWNKIAVEMYNFFAHVHSST